MLGGRAESPLPARRRRLLVALLLALAAALQSVSASSAEGPTIESASDGPYGYAWKPSTAAIGAGGSVTFRSTSAVIPHGVTWKSVPETPSCNGVPIDEEKTSWSGSCTFAQPGSYAFVCSVHPTEMKGTVTVSSGEAPPTNPPPGGSSESPLAGRASSALRVARSQRGGAVRGSIALSQAAAGGKLEIQLLARRAALLGAGRSGTMRVGKLIRSHLNAGRLSFRVSLKRVARIALRGSERLALTVRITVRAPSQEPLKLKRGVVLHV